MKKEIKAKIVIGVPHNQEFLYTKFVWSLLNLDRPTDSKIAWGNCGEVFRSRNNIVNSAMKINATHLLFIDSDHTFPFYALKKLIDSNKRIISACYRNRLLPDRLAGTDKKKMPLRNDLSGIQEVGGVGGGFLLINMDVFKKIGKPYFMLFTDKDGEQFAKGHDIYFCDKAREAGEKIYMDYDLKLEHLTVRDIN